MAVLSGERLHTNMDKLLPGARSAALLWHCLLYTSDAADE